MMSNGGWPNVVAHEPKRTDVAVVTTIGSARLGLHPIYQYNEAYFQASKLSVQLDAQAEVTPIDTRDLLSLSGMSPEDFIRSLDEATKLELRLLAIDACVDALLHCNDRAVRSEAAAVLTKLGVF